MDAPPRAGEYRVIYADPPWRFAAYSDKGKGRSAEAHYDCLSLDDIKRFPVALWAAPHAVLLLWATDPLLPRALEVIEAWGFAYKTVGFYWVKLNAAVGGRLSREWPLLARARFLHRPRLLDPGQSRALPVGDAQSAKRLAGDVPKLLIAPRRQHSRKPDETYARIERLLPGPYLELFARQSRAGWMASATRGSCLMAGPWSPAGGHRRDR